MNALFNLPPEVLVKSIIPLLGWNDLLRLRRTCKAAKSLVDERLRKHPEVAPELEINEKEKNIRAFMDLGIPTRKIFLNNASGSGSQFYSRAPQTTSRFLAEYAPTVTHLRVAQLSMFCTEKAKLFLGAFVNLESFEAGEIILTRHTRNTKSTVAGLIGLTDLPSGVFENVRALKLGQRRDCDRFLIDTFDEFLYKCSNLELISLCVPIDPMSDRTLVWLGRMFRLYFVIVQRMGGVLKVIDLSDLLKGYLTNQFIHEFVRTGFNILCRACAAHNVQIIGVHENWFNLPEQLPRGPRDPQLAELGNPIVSLIVTSFPNGGLLQLDFPNLEKLGIQLAPAVNWSEAQPNLRRLPCNLPKLKSLAFQLDSVIGARITCQWLFDGVTSENLTELRVGIATNRNVDVLPILSNRLSMRSCPSLKRLTIENLRGSNTSGDVLGRLWDILGGTLEELTFADCTGLEDYHFVGADENNPVLMKLFNLKKLTLDSLDLQPGITDALFLKVIRRMELSHLTLISNDAVPSVNVTGIESLLEGPFAESIEHFPFHGWSLPGVTPEEFQALENKFRCKNLM